MSRHNCLFCFLPPNFEALRTDYSVSAGLLLKSVTLSPCTQGWTLREDGFDLLSARLYKFFLLFYVSEHSWFPISPCVWFLLNIQGTRLCR